MAATQGVKVATNAVEFQMQVCGRCGRETIHALAPGAAEHYAVCSACEPGVFERLAWEAGRRELRG